MWSYGRFLYCSPHCWAPEKITYEEKPMWTNLEQVHVHHYPHHHHRVRSGAPVRGGLGHLALEPVHRPLPLRGLQNQVVSHLERWHRCRGWGYFTQKGNIWKPPRVRGHFLMTFPGNWEKHLGTFSHRWALAWGSHQALDCLVSSTRIWEKGKRGNIDLSNIVILLQVHFFFLARGH